ncbi:complex I NDUFA9 subunit family protein [Faunimonas pinastri]|nr:complex I NDUFA9 subunit family protein [Faunimonas pinastri]
MSDTTDPLVTVFGGSGFLGRYVVRSLARRGYRIRVAVRRPDLAGFLQPLGTVGQIRGVQANLRYRESVERAVSGAVAVVNCVGILSPSGRQSFEALHAAGAGAIAEASRDAGVQKMVHVSAIGADAQGASGYQRSKAAGEQNVFSALPDAVVMRPSLVFGPEDEFFNRFASMARIAPFLPLIGGGATRFQPVYAADVGEAIARAVDGQARPGAIYELGGPEVLTFRECMELMLEVTQRKRHFMNVPFSLAGTMAKLGGALGMGPLTPDQVRMLRHDNIVSAQAVAEELTLRGLGVEPTALEVILPTYLQRFRQAGQFTKIAA